MGHRTQISSAAPVAAMASPAATDGSCTPPKVSKSWLIETRCCPVGFGLAEVGCGRIVKDESRWQTPACRSLARGADGEDTRK